MVLVQNFLSKITRYTVPPSIQSYKARSIIVWLKEFVIFGKSRVNTRSVVRYTKTHKEEGVTT